ncbi:MAG: prolipoprotein diacylglyceryl transferase [Clostridia bacterium]|nr:prolipoprotein diacylglyceryl transferase [Clostridia bacterium]
MDFTKISFPGVGIEPFKVKSVPFGQISWSTLIILVGAILAFFYVAFRAKRSEGIKKRVTLLFSAAAVVLGVIFARAAYVIATWDTVGYKSFGEVAAFWDGMTIGGGLVGGLLAIVILCDIFKINSLRMFDLFLPGVLLVQLLASVGTFLDAEIYGSVIGETTSFYCISSACEMTAGEGSIWALLSMTLDKGGEVLAYHPIFLYQFVWFLIGFLAAHFTCNHTRFKGQIALFYFGWFGLGSAFVAGLEAPVNGGVHGVQLLSLIVGALAFVALLVRFLFSVNRGIKIEGETPEKRSFSQMMTSEERMEKRTKDVAYITTVLDEKADKVYGEMTAEPAVEVEEEETAEA